MQHAFLAGYAAATGDARKKSTDGPIEPFLSVDRMFFVSAFQGGVDHFLSPIHTDHTKGLEFLQSRFSEPKKRDYEVTDQISRTFKEFRRNTTDDYDYVHVTAFVADLICAMRNNASMLSVMPVPEPIELSRGFVPESAMPLIQLVSGFQTYTETVPVPRTSVSSDGLRRFQEIIESGTFERYSRQHLYLQEEDSNVSSILNTVRTSGRSVLERGR